MNKERVSDRLEGRGELSPQASCILYVLRRIEKHPASEDVEMRLTQRLRRTSGVGSEDYLHE